MSYKIKHTIKFIPFRIFSYRYQTMDPGLEHGLTQFGFNTAFERSKFGNQSRLATLQDFILFENDDLDKIASQLSRRNPASIRLNVKQI